MIFLPCGCIYIYIYSHCNKNLHPLSVLRFLSGHNQIIFSVWLYQSLSGSIMAQSPFSTWVHWVLQAFVYAQLLTVQQAQIITPPPLCTVVSKRFQVHHSTLSDCSTKTDVPPWMCAVKSTVSCGLVADVQSPVCFLLCACTITFRPTLERV